MKSITTAPYRPSEHANTLPTIPENKDVDFQVTNFRRLARENQALSMRVPFIGNRLMRVSAYHDLTKLGGLIGLTQS